MKQIQSQACVLKETPSFIFMFSPSTCKHRGKSQGRKRRALSDWQSCSPSLSLSVPSHPVCYSLPGCSWEIPEGMHITGNSFLSRLRWWISPLTAAGQQHAEPQTCWVKTYVHRAPSRLSGEKPTPVLSGGCRADGHCLWLPLVLVG